MVNGILAPMPGKVVAVKKNVGDEVRVKEGDSVDAEDVLVVIS